MNLAKISILSLLPIYLYLIIIINPTFFPSHLIANLPFKIYSGEHFRNLAENDYPLLPERKIYYYSLSSLANPIDYLSRYNLAITLWKNYGSHNEIIRLFKDANFLYPINDKILMQMAFFYLSKSDIEEAIKYFRKSAEINKENLPYIYEKVKHLGDSYINSVTPNNYEALGYLINYYERKRDNEAAGRFLKVAFDYSNPEQKLYIIQKLLDLNQLSKAESLIKRLENKMQEEADFYWIYSQFYLLKGDSKKFSAMLDKALKTKSNYFSNDQNKLNDFYIDVANKLMKYGISKTAELLYLKVLNKDFYNAKANEGLARCYFFKKDLHKAFVYATKAEENLNTQQFILEIFKEALRMNNDYVIKEIINYLKDKHLSTGLAYFANSLYYKNKGDMIEATSFIEKALEQEPANHIFLREAASLYLSLYDYDTSIKYYEKLLELEPSNNSIYSELFKLYLSSGNADKIANLCKQADSNYVSLNECFK